MATAVVSMICIALILLGGMAMSQGILTSVDTTAFSVEEISTREGEITRTEIITTRAETLSWADMLRVTVDNHGQTKLAGFGKWDLIVHYQDNSGNSYTRWLPYTEGVLSNNEWRKERIGLNGPTEYYEPGILNPEEDLVILAKLSPLPGDATTGDVIVATPNGIDDSISFSRLGYTMLNPHSENTTLNGVRYYEMAEASPSDGPAVTETTDAFGVNEIARKMLHDETDPSRAARHIFPLVGISQIPAGTWTVYYRCRTLGDSGFPNQAGDVNFNIDILVRQADGSVRTILATRVAIAYLDEGDAGTWLTPAATYDFPGYTVIDESDYLEIVYYGQTVSAGPPNTPAYLQIRIDDSNLAVADQTRIRA